MNLSNVFNNKASHGLFLESLYKALRKASSCMYSNTYLGAKSSHSDLHVTRMSSEQNKKLSVNEGIFQMAVRILWMMLASLFPFVMSGA